METWKCCQCINYWLSFQTFNELLQCEAIVAFYHSVWMQNGCFVSQFLNWFLKSLISSLKNQDIYKRRRTTWIVLVWSEHLKLHPFWLLIGWQKNCRIQAFSEVGVCVNFWEAKKVHNWDFLRICGVQQLASFLFLFPWENFFGGNPNEKLAQMTTFFEELGLDPSKQ